MNVNTRARAWCFTINNDTMDDLIEVIDIKSRYLCFGFEVGKEGTEHIQGYVYFDNPRTFQSVKKMLSRAHLEISRGTSKENAIYTSKDGDWYEFGDRPLQGRASWEAIEDAMQDPTYNPHLHNQYYKMYRRIKLSEIKEHDRTLRLIRSDKLYETARNHSNDGHTIMLDEPIENYDGQDVVFLKCYEVNSTVLSWINKFPPNIRRGYELIRFDPLFVYMLYDDKKEQAFLNKKYNEYIDKCIIDVDIQHLGHIDQEELILEDS